MSHTIEDQLTSCDREPIHAIGSVQEHGALLAFAPNDRRITNASENLQSILGVSAHQALGKRVEEFLAPGDLEVLLEGIEQAVKTGESYLRLTPLKGGGTAEGYLFESEGLVALEIQALRTGRADSASLLNTTQRAFIQNLHQRSSMVDAARLASQAVRTLTGFERVMIYKFLSNWDGQVVAEDRSAEAHSFLEHRFPAGDIPLPARELYKLNRNRLIPDRDAKTYPITPARNPRTGQALDLSRSKLRAVSPVHLEYLRNMGVRSSFSIAIVSEDKLWGLIACHGNEPVTLPNEVRTACEMIGSMFGMIAGLMEKLTDQQDRLGYENGLRALFQDLKPQAGPLDTLFRMHRRVLDLFAADGMAFVTTGFTDIAGFTPPIVQVNRIAEFAAQKMREQHVDIWATESFSEWEGAPKDVAADGVLAIALPEVRDSMFLLFRRELAETITWGGDPRKSVERRNYDGAINPRKSFESWSETIRDRSSRWEAHQIQGARYLRDFVFDALVKKEMLIEELSHRKK